MAAKTNICFFPTATFTQDYSVLGKVETNCLLTHLGYSLTADWHLLPCAVRGRGPKKVHSKTTSAFQEGQLQGAYRHKAIMLTFSRTTEPSQKKVKGTKKSKKQMQNAEKEEDRHNYHQRTAADFLASRRQQGKTHNYCSGHSS